MDTATRTETGVGQNQVDTEGVTPEGNRIVHLPTEEDRWRKAVAEHAQEAVGASFTPDQATPSAVRSIPNSEALKEVEAVRTDAAPTIDMVDIKDRIKKTTSHTFNSIGTAIGFEEPSTYNETAKGHKVVSFVHEKAKKAASLKGDQDQEAA